MNKKQTNVLASEKDIKNESAKLNGVEVNSHDFEMPRNTYDMLEQTCQIA